MKILKIYEIVLLIFGTLLISNCDNKCKEGCIAVIRGKVVNSKTKKEVEGVKVSINNDEAFALTNKDGIYLINYSLQDNYIYDFKNITASKQPLFNDKEKIDMIVKFGENNSNEEYDYDFEIDPKGDLQTDPPLNSTFCIENGELDFNFLIYNQGIEEVNYSISSLSTWISVLPINEEGVVPTSSPVSIGLNINNTNLACENIGEIVLINSTIMNNDTILIKKLNEDIQAPFVDFSFEPSSPLQNNPVNFSSLSIDNCTDSNNLLFEWRFDSELAFTPLNNVDNVISFVYDDVGDKIVTLRVTDENGNIAQATRTFVVQVAPTLPICDPNVQVVSNGDLSIDVYASVLSYGQTFENIGLIEHGFILGTSSSIDLNNFEDIINIGPLAGLSAPQNINSLFEGLKPLTKYYIRFYARNGLGVCYSDAILYQEDLLDFQPMNQGNLTMGTGFGNEDYSPEHTLLIDAFDIAKTETTNREFAIFLNTDVQGSQVLNYIDLSNSDIYQSGGIFYVDSGRENYPITGITWNGAKTFCEWAGGSQNGRLPSEAQWEYAAKGGSPNAPYIYSGSDDANSVGWSQENSFGQTHPVGQLLPNSKELYDVSGNASEWVSDWYDENYYDDSPINNPTGPNSGLQKVVRGGNKASPITFLRVFHRAKLNPSATNVNTGCRCIKDYSE